MIFSIMIFIIDNLFLTAVPIAFVLIPFIVDMANGRDDTSDIVVH